MGATRPAIALLEYSSVAVGVLAVDQMLKASPIAVVQCGTVHPGRYLALVGGTVASTEEAFGEGCRIGADGGALLDAVCLSDPHPLLAAAVAGARTEPRSEASGVLEVSSCPGLLRVLDAILKAVPVELVEVRLADDLGGCAMAVVDGALPDVQEALELASLKAGTAEILATSLMPRIDDTLRKVLGEGTRFAECARWQPPGGEQVEG
jgi:microcompartment protein CcmL/EutN